jgi:hypothetical protein
MLVFFRVFHRYLPLRMSKKKYAESAKSSPREKNVLKTVLKPRKKCAENAESGLAEMLKKVLKAVLKYARSAFH